jgi:hypothetical protein
MRDGPALLIPACSRAETPDTPLITSSGRLPLSHAQQPLRLGRPYVRVLDSLADNRGAVLPGIVPHEAQELPESALRDTTSGERAYWRRHLIDFRAAHDEVCHRDNRPCRPGPRVSPVDDHRAAASQHHIRGMEIQVQHLVTRPRPGHSPAGAGIAGGDGSVE